MLEGHQACSMRPGLTSSAQAAPKPNAVRSRRARFAEDDGAAACSSFAAYDLRTVDVGLFRQQVGATCLDSDTDSSFSLSTDGFWERRSTFEQWLLVLCASVVLMTCMTLTYTFYYAREYGKAERLKQVGIEYYDCQTQVCKDAAIELKDTLNLNRDPCKNFYEYACSLWPSRYPVPDDMGHYSVHDFVRDEVTKRILATFRKGPLDVDQRLGDETAAMRLFYSCHDVRGRQHDALQPLTRVMRALSLSEWPYELGERLPRARFVLQRLSIDYALPFFVSLRVEPDPRDARANLLAVDLGEPMLHSNFVREATDEYRALLRAHAAYIRRTMAIMGAHDMAAAVATDVHDYEFALAELSNYQTLRELTEFSSDNIVTLDKLQQGATLELLASIAREAYQRGGVAARWDEEVLVWNVSTLRALDKFLASENRRMLLNYLGWRVVALLGPATTVDMMNARHAFYMVKFGAEDQPQLLGYCFEQATRMLPVAMGRMAYRAVGGADSAQRLVSRMVEEIRASLLLLLRGSDVSWLNEQSKEIAIKKIRRLRLIQQPVNSTALDWKPPKLHPESSFGTNVAILLSAKAEQSWKRLGRYNYFDSVPVPQLRMGISYDVYRNAIVVPAILTGLGLSTPGVLALDLSPSINFGAFGYLVAHEMLRSIMFSGSVIDVDGSFSNWHLRDTSAKFRILVNCFESMLRRTLTNELTRRVRASSLALSQMLIRELVIGSTALPAAFKGTAKMDASTSNGPDWTSVFQGSCINPFRMLGVAASHEPVASKHDRACRKHRSRR
ncbi:neprilysin-1-like isoform X3 [Dermacentor albipictus]|uniref:neprilysin-1-like isoform X3 n=1 Tax=Dermacentor albipictus TaxID=60249 RepID=UPI0031FDE178